MKIRIFVLAALVCIALCPRAQAESRVFILTLQAERETTTPAQTAHSPVITDPKSIIKVYTVQHSTPTELVTIITAFVPGVQIMLGPQPKFVRDTPAGETLGADSASTASQTGSLAPAGGVNVNVADQFVRVLILKGLPENITKAVALLTELDIPAPQVLIEAKIVELDAGASSQLGVTWNFAPNGTTAQFTEGTPASKGSADSVIFGRLDRGPISFDATLAAAIQNNKAKLLANPRLVVLYNHRARIFIGDEVTYLLGSQVSQNGTTLQTGRVKVGVQLNVAASSSPDGSIDLKVDPEVGTLNMINTQSNGVSLPDISRREVTTAIRLKDGETLVIGGLIQENDTKTVNKLPILGDLPLFGHLFRSDSVTKSKTELVIFLKATIVKE